MAVSVDSIGEHSVVENKRRQLWDAAVPLVMAYILVTWWSLWFWPPSFREASSPYHHTPYAEIAVAIRLIDRPANRAIDRVIRQEIGWWCSEQ
jgi:hypothetical protein